MSYAVKTQAHTLANIKPYDANDGTPPQFFNRDAGAKVAKFGDHSKLQESVKNILCRAAEIRKETAILRTVRLVGRSRSKVYDIINEASSTVDEAKTVLNGMSAAVAHSRGAQGKNGEQDMKRLTQQKLAKDLLEASQELVSARETFERTAEAREKKLKDADVLRGIPSPENCKPSVGARAEDESHSSDPRTHLNDHRKSPAQECRLQMSQEAETDIHIERVNQTEEDVRVIHREFTMLQRTMVDLGTLVQSQAEMLDNIEASFHSANNNVDRANMQVVQANQRQAKGSVLVCALLALVFCMAILVIVAAVAKSEHKSKLNNFLG